MADEDDGKEYRWETGYEKTWEAIKEDKDGLMDQAIADLILAAKRKRQAEKKGNNRLGMMRHLFIVIDCSESMSLQDLKPTRLICTLRLLEMFIEEFFDQNPISQIGIVAMKNKRAEKISDLAGISKKHLKTMQELQKLNLVGEPSIQNGLEIALTSLKNIPTHASREILIIMGSLTTCDPTDINITIDKLKKEGVRCSVLSLSSEVQICRQLVRETGGTFGAALDDSHFKDQLFAHIDPPTASKNQENSLIKMGFPYDKTESKDQDFTMCICHIDSKDEPSVLSSHGYHCTQCGSKYCELPVECKSCDLTLVSAPHLARSYHHLFPVDGFRELLYEKQAELCFSCQYEFPDTEKHIYKCENCHQMFCIDCDIFIHESLHTCVGCTTLPAAAENHFRKNSLYNKDCN